MPLISNANLQKITDKAAYVYERMLAHCGGGAFGAYAAGTDQYLLNRALSDLVGIGDFEQQNDMEPGVYRSLSSCDRKSVALRSLAPFVSAVNAHVAARGRDADPSVVDLVTYLAFYDATLYAVLLDPQFAQLYLDTQGVQLTPAGVMQPSTHPSFTPAASSGLGTRAVGSAFVAGAQPDVLDYAAPLSCAQVTADFASGTAPPTVAVAGTDDAGLLTTTWGGTFTGDNPVAAVSTTITPAITGPTRVDVAVGSVAGVVVGSVLCVNAGLVDQEFVSVEAVSGSTITAVFDKGHNAGATLTGGTTIRLTPSVTGKRLASISGFTIGVTGHTAGTVMVFGALDRRHDPT